MSNIAIRVENCILSGAKLSKLYPAVAPRARHLGRAQQRHDTPSNVDRRSGQGCATRSWTL